MKNDTRIILEEIDEIEEENSNSKSTETDIIDEKDILKAIDDANDEYNKIVKDAYASYDNHTGTKLLIIVGILVVVVLFQIAASIIGHKGSKDVEYDDYDRHHSSGGEIVIQQEVGGE